MWGRRASPSSAAGGEGSSSERGRSRAGVVPSSPRSPPAPAAQTTHQHPTPPPLLLATVDASHDPGLVVSPSGDVLHLNSAARRLFERGRRDAISRRTVFSFFSLTPTSLDGVDPKIKGRGKIARETWRCVEGNLKAKFTTREATAYLPDGSTFPASVNLFKSDGGGGGGSAGRSGGGDNGTNPEDRDAHSDNDGALADGCACVCAFVKDLTHDRLLAELETQLRGVDAENLKLRRSQDALIVASGDSTVIIDEDGIIHSLDEVTQRTFGYSEGELVGMNVSVLMGKEHASRHDGYIQRYLRTGERRVMGKKREVNARRKDGSTLRVELGISEIRTDPWEKRMFAGMLRDISERNAAFLMLERSERLRDAILNANRDAMFSLSPRGRIETANRSATALFGWTEEELRGKHITCLVAEEDVAEVREDLVHGGLAASYSRANSSISDRSGGGSSSNEPGADDAASVSTAGSRPIAVDHELTGLRRDGSTFPISFDLARISSKSVPGKTRPCAAFVRDLTKRKAQEAALEHRSAVNRGVLEASFDSIFLIDERGIIEVVNRSAIERFGWTREEFIGKNISMICGGHHAERHDEYMRRYLETGRTGVMGRRRTLPAKRKDGTEFDIELGLVEVEATGGEESRRWREVRPREGRMFCAYVRDASPRPSSSGGDGGGGGGDGGGGEGGGGEGSA